MPQKKILFYSKTNYLNELIYFNTQEIHAFLSTFIVFRKFKNTISNEPLFLVFSVKSLERKQNNMYKETFHLKIHSTGKRYFS